MLINPAIEPQGAFYLWTRVDLPQSAREVRAALRELAQGWQGQADASAACVAFVARLQRAAV